IWLDPGAKKPAEKDDPLIIDLTPKKKDAQNAEARGGGETHTVRRGDTLWDIAQAYNVSIADIKRWNGMRSNKIKPGLVLKVRP
ncbi:MAG: LysM peptidoglycan-binding domain-containing protein, partial [Calditrichota bacterium]